MRPTPIRAVPSYTPGRVPGVRAKGGLIRSLPGWKTDPTVRTATDPRQLPSIGGNVVTQDVEIVLGVLDLEVPVIGRQPPVDNVGDLDLALPKPEPSRRLLATIAGVALDINNRECGRPFS
jgi:hypothetical protein